MVKHVDVSNNLELLSLAEEVARTGETIVLQKDSKDLATVVPTTGAPKWRPTKPTEADVTASRSTAGSWADVDVEEFMRYVYEGRRSSKPPVDL